MGASERIAAIQHAAEARLLEQDLATALNEESEDEVDFDPVGGNAGDLLMLAAVSSDDSSDED